MHDLAVRAPTPVTTPPRTAGIVSSARPQGWLAKRWLAGLDALPARHQSRLARGRTFARGGRVQDLWFSPGLVTASVSDGESHRVSVRVRVFEDAEWGAVVTALAEDLRLVAKLMEGTLPPPLVQRLEAAGVRLLPRVDELDGDCDCADYLMPCVHTAAVHQLLADALDGDPFLLFTLRGWHRDRVLHRLRRDWGDPAGVGGAARPADEAAPEGDWCASPAALGPMGFDFAEPEGSPAGLRALGPAPDDGDLERALGPLYAAGSQAAHRLAVEEDATELLDRRRRALESRGRAVLREEALDDDSAERAFTERLVDVLAEMESARTRDLAARLDVSLSEVRAELIELEELGLVYRTGQTRGTRWWLG
jgi:uncharacterized Zn finger protein